MKLNQTKTIKITELRQLIKEEIQNTLNIQKFIDDKEFMKSFIANARLAYKYTGGYKDMFWLFEEDGLTEEQVGDLLEYLVKINKIKQ
jgi:N-glycosylase/DNA lyase